MAESISGIGKKRPLINLSVTKLKLDKNNPRLSEFIQGKSEKEIQENLVNEFELRELADSFSKNGYFDEEPLVAIPDHLPEKFKSKTYLELKSDPEYLSYIEKKETTFTVVEGNRRLATIKILLSTQLQDEFKVKDWPKPSEENMEDLKIVPVIIYPTRDEIVPYLGVRHIAGIKKWDPYAKARYIASIVEENKDLYEVQQRVGDRGLSTIKSYICLKLIELVEEEMEASAKKAKEFFSYLLLSTGQRSIKEYIGLPTNWKEVDINKIIPDDKYESLKNLFSYLFGEGKDKLAIIKESRDITGKLSKVLSIKHSADYLYKTRDLQTAFDQTDGEEENLLSLLTKANKLLESSLSVVHKYTKNEQVHDKIDECSETIKQLKKQAN
ncbi:MAG: hypothetical protein V1859_01800 [archaeon]